MNESETKAETLSIDYAKRLGFEVFETTSIEIEHDGFWIFRYPTWARVALVTNAGVAESTLWARASNIHSFIVQPSESDGELLPLWLAFPAYDSVTSGWRQGSGELYKYKWHDWWRTLPDLKKEQYKLKFPEPTDEERGEWTGGWEGFYDEIADVPGDPASIPDLLFGRVPQGHRRR